MHVFQIRYRNTQGTLMRVLTAATRRGIDLPYVQAEPAERDHRVTLLLEVNQKQVGQLSRDWYAIVDVLDVHTGIALPNAVELAHSRTLAAHPPTSAVFPREARVPQALA
jgi:acetolactate synthase small subunit